MPRRSAEIKEWVQLIDEDMKEDFKFSPSEIPYWFVRNVFTRALAHLIAYTEQNKPIKLRATSEGLLKVSTYPEIFEDYEPFSGTAKDDFDPTTTYEFPESYNRWDILLEGGDAIIAFKKNDGTWGKEITLPEGFHSYEFSGLGIKIKNRTAGVNVDYEITVFR